jgi:hypothetical protein
VSDFEGRAFWTLTEVLDVLEKHHNRRTVASWLKQAECITENPGGAAVVTRSDLEAKLAFVLEELRRDYEAQEERSRAVSCSLSPRPTRN